MDTENGVVHNYGMQDTRKELSTPASEQEGNPLTDASQKRRERIKRLEARLQREKARDSVASRRERNGQLYVWGAMVEGVFRTGSVDERRQLREWAARQLTDKRHLQRAERGFARIDAENAEKAAEQAECDTSPVIAPQPVPARP